MKTILYGVSVQFKMDLRSNTLLVTCYAVPLLFFLIMGGIFTSLMPEAKQTLIPAMSIMGISMGAFIGVPPSMVEIYATDIKKMYMLWCYYFGNQCLYSLNDHKHTYFYICSDYVSCGYSFQYPSLFHNPCFVYYRITYCCMCTWFGS